MTPRSRKTYSWHHCRSPGAAAAISSCERVQNVETAIARARGGGSARRRAVAVGVVELLVGNGRDNDRQLDPRPEHGRRRRDLGHVAEDARPERPAPEGGAVLAQRPFVARAAGEVRPRPRLEPLLGEPLVVRDREARLHGYDSSAVRRKTSAAASWNPVGRSCAAMLCAISSISPIQRQPLRARRALGAREALLELGDREPPLLEQRVLDSLGPGELTHREQQGRAALRPAGIGRLQRRCGAELAEITRASTLVPEKSAAISAASPPER